MAVMRVIVIAMVASLLSSCFGIPPTEDRIPSVEVAGADVRSDTVVVMLPGRGDRADTFLREGFENAGQALGFDTIAVDAHFGYYMKRSLLDRLHEDIVLPAREAGYKNVWLLGISMGGFGTLLYASKYPDQVDGIVLLAPYVGDRDSLEEIRASGGLDSWDGDASELEEYEIRIWNWLRDTDTPIVLGYGESDRMAEGYSQFAELLEPGNIYTREGGHKWTTWRPLWDQIAPDLQL